MHNIKVSNKLTAENQYKAFCYLL